MPSVIRGLDATRTAQWYEKARNSDSWAERQRCFDALSAALEEHRVPARPFERPRQPSIQIPGILTEVARRIHFSREPVYKRWRAQQDARQIPRWAGSDPRVTPAAAFIAEAKVVAYWPYRAAALDVAGTFDTTEAETLTAYLRSLAAWAADRLALAACLPSGPPACVVEDMEVFAAGDRARTSRLIALCRAVVELVVEDPSMTPLGAFNAVRDEVSAMYSDPRRIADRVNYSLVELSDQLMHTAGCDALVDADQASRILASLDELKQLLTRDVAVSRANGDLR